MLRIRQTHPAARPVPSAARAALLLAALAVTALLACAASALALSGSPVNVGTPFANGQPVVAVDAAGEAVLAWANTRDLPPETVNVVQVCVLPVGAVACAHSVTLTPADGAQYIDDVQVLNDGGAIVVLADVFGAGSEEYEPEQEWQSTDGGATFTAVNGGKSVTSGILSAVTEPLGAVILPGTGVLGYGWNTAGEEPPTFNAFPLSSPPQCSTKTCPAGFSSLQPNTNPDQIGNAGGQFASQQGASPGVLGIFNTDFSNGPLGCNEGGGLVPFGTAYVYGSGPQAASNSYNISPGMPNSAWKVPVTQADCNAEYPAVGGGPSGFGIVEDNLANNLFIYHPFDQATMKFDTPQSTISSDFAESPSVSQDGSGGIYVTYLAGAGGSPIRLAYSGNGGASWIGPATLNPDADERGNELSRLVNGAGQGWAVWSDNGSIIAQPFDAADATPPPPPPPPPASTPVADTLTTIQTSGTAVGASLSIPVGTIGETDRATLSGTKAAIATGTVSYNLYSSASCVSPSKVFSGGASAMSGGVAAPSAGVTSALAPGTYYWQAAYSGDANNVPSTSACGSEVLTVGPAATIEGTGTSTSTTVTLTITCATTPCTVTVTITIGTGGSKASVARKHKSKRPKIVTLAAGTFTLTSKGPHKLTLHLTKSGKQLLARNHGHLEANVLLSEKTAGGVELTRRTITFSPVAKHKRRK